MPQGFTRPVVALLGDAKIIGVRAGEAPHRFIGVWVVTVGRRIFVRSWNNKPTGWYRAFLAEPRGVLQVADREIRVRGRRCSAERVLDAVDQAYREKYRTPGALKYVRGFVRPRRRAATLELLPR
jgi:hypothetical protein